MTDDGPVVTFECPYKLPECPEADMPPLVKRYPWGMSRSQVIRDLMNCEYSISLILAHDPPIPKPEDVSEMDHHLDHIDKRVLLEGEFYRDDFGCFVYAVPYFSTGPSQLFDWRFDKT